jgi:hypothetical protein
MSGPEPLDRIWKGKGWSDGERVTRVPQVDGSYAEGTASLAYGWDPNTSTFVKLKVDSSGNLVVSSGSPLTLTTNHWVSAASTNPTVVKASSGQVFTYMAFNNGGAWAYLKLFDKVAVPVPGTDTPRLTIGLPPGGGANLTVQQGILFSAGIGFAITAGAADADTSAVNANQVVVNLLYQ